MSIAVVGAKLTFGDYNLMADFISELSHGETILSASTAVTVQSGVDNSPSDILSGSGVISGTTVRQVLTTGVDGVIYSVTVSATTSAANVLTQTFSLAFSFSGLSPSDMLVTTLGGTPASAFTYVVTGLGIAFTDTSTDVYGTISKWLWTFGDSHTSNLQNPSHTYAATGDFSVSLTITDSYSGKTSTSTQTVTISPAASGLVSPLGLAGATYSTSKSSATFSATASLTFTLFSNGTWTIANSSGAVLDSGNWYNPPVAGIGSTFTAKYTPTLGVTGTYWTLTNPAAAATSLATDLVLIMKEHGIFDGTDVTSGTIKVDFAGAATGTGTFNFSVTITTNDGSGP